MSHKVAFTSDDDALLMKYIARYNPRPKGRLGLKLYERLVENTERKWSFSSRHSLQSWRERYKNNQRRFDAQILKYQKKHGISADAPVIPSSQAAGRDGARKSLTSSPVSRTGAINHSAAPLKENRTKKRPRETDSGDESFDSRVAKKMRQENAPRTSPPLVEPRNTGKARADPLFLEEEDEAPAIGADDYTGALSDSGENNQEAEYRASASASSSRSVNQGAVKLFMSPSRFPNLSHVGATSALDKPPPNQDTIITQSPSRTVVAQASRSIRGPADSSLQPSQELTPPHTSVIDSPRSPLQRQLSPASDTSLRPGIIPQHFISTSVNERCSRPSSPRKQITVPVEEDDIFCTPPPQSVRASPPPRTRARDAPRLVEGPFRSVYANANRESRSTLRDSHGNGMGGEVEGDDQDEEWPPKRDKRKSPIPLPNGTPLPESEQPTVNIERLRSPKAPPASEAVPVDNSSLIATAMSTRESDMNDRNLKGSSLAKSRGNPAPSPISQVAAVPDTNNARRPLLQPNAIASSSRDRLSSASERHVSPHDSLGVAMGGKPTASKAGLKPVPARELTRAEAQVPIMDRNRLLFPAVSAHELPPPAPGPPSKRPALLQYPTLADDPFTVSLVDCGARRRTLGDAGGVPRVGVCSEEPTRRASVQHIDLRALHSGKSAGASRTGSAVSRSNSRNSSRSESVAKNNRSHSPTRLSTLSNLSESNRELVLALGLEAVYARMAENHKFHIDVVREVATRQRSLEDADRVLRRMREAAGREYERLLMHEGTRGTVEDEAEESEEEEEEEEEDADESGSDDEDRPPVRSSQAILISKHSSARVAPQGRARQAALKITTESPDSFPVRLPHYSPPTPTRAHEFRRLERQGRVEEARSREARRVRRSLQMNSSESSPEMDERRIAAYLLQQQEQHSLNAAPAEDRHWDINGLEQHGEQDEEDDREEGIDPSISPRAEDGRADSDAWQFQRSRLADEDEVAANTTTEPWYDPGTLFDSQGHQSPSPPLSPPSCPHSEDSDEAVSTEDESYETAMIVDTELFDGLSEVSDEDVNEAAEVEKQVDADVRFHTLGLYKDEPNAESPGANAEKGAWFTNEHQASRENVFVEWNGNFDAVQKLEREHTNQADSSLPSSPLATSLLPDAEWTNSDDELLLDGDLTGHKELARRKGLSSVKFRTAHLYSLLLDA